MSTDDQRKGFEIHGEALKIARDEVPEYLQERLAKRPAARRRPYRVRAR